MFTSLKVFSRMLAATLATAGLLLPAVASAQYGPPNGQPQGYGQPQGQPQEETIHGRIYSINATFEITVTDDNGYMDNIELHQGTIINPTGLTLAPGMEVTITGFGAGSVFSANEIDTPYAYEGPAPVSVYYGPGWWYPGYSYGYGPSFVLDFAFFGGGYRFERHNFDRNNFWAVRSDVRFRGSNGFRNGFVPRTGYSSNGNRGYTTTRNGSANTGYRGNTSTGNYNGTRNNNSGYTTPTRTWSSNTNGNPNYSTRSGGSANYSTRSGGNTNYSARSGGNANYGARNNGNTGYRGAPQGQNSRSAGSTVRAGSSTRSDNTRSGNQNNHGH